MKFRFRCSTLADNDPPPGGELLYNVVATPVRDDPENMAQFGGTPSGTLALSGLRGKFPAGQGETFIVTIEPESAEQPAEQPGAPPPPPRRTFGRTNQPT
jgi:hypothetical protein